MNTLKFLLTIVLLSFLLFGCNNDDETSRLRIMMVDAPADYQEVNIEIKDILVHTSSIAEDNEEGWVSVITDDSRDKIYNLLDLVNGEYALLADTEFPAGKLSQIRLVLGEQNTLKFDNELIPLETPSAQQSGLKLNLKQELSNAFTYNIILDFDAAQSIVNTGSSDKYILKPVIRCKAEENSGAIKGAVALVGNKALVTATNGEVQFNSYTDENGAFLIKGVDPGTYQLSFEFPELANKETVEDVTVEVGKINDIGALSFAILQ